MIMISWEGLNGAVNQSVHEDYDEMFHDGQGSSSNPMTTSMFEGLEDLSLCDDEDMVDEGEKSEMDIWDVNFQTFTPIDMKLLEFANADAAYDFYNEYGLANGFSIRKNRTVRSKKKEDSSSLVDDIFNLI